MDDKTLISVLRVIGLVGLRNVADARRPALFLDEIALYAGLVALLAQLEIAEVVSHTEPYAGDGDAEVSAVAEVLSAGMIADDQVDAVANGRHALQRHVETVVHQLLG